jgi:O-6-methylguanine DNA methyltransferase
MFCTQYDSPVGPLTLSSDGAALTGLAFGPCGEPSASLPLFDDAFLWLDAYFSGRDPGPTPPLAPRGTGFQRRVWQELLTIPFGRTASYGKLAQAVDCRSARAVGQAVHNNPIALMIPCHRVIGADGSLTGFAGGLDVKRRLLALEESRMRLLFTLDRGDYEEGKKSFSRPSARAIVIQGGRVAMIYSRKFQHFKFPGGGIERGETREAALIREAREEAGLVLDPESVRPYGFVHRIEKGDAEPIFLQDNFYYLASASAIVPQELDGYEAEEGYTLRWVEPREAIEQNKALTTAYQRKYHTMLLREAMVLERLIAEELLGPLTSPTI